MAEASRLALKPENRLRAKRPPRLPALSRSWGASTGNISDAWTASDTAIPGTYQLWYVVTTTGGAKEHAVGPDTLIVTNAP
jgi:hypothetical protein